MIGFVLGYIVNIVTFPGVMVHEYAHYKMCHWQGIPVHEVTFFQFGNPAGYVVHDEPDHYADALAIAGAPFLINSLLALGLFTYVSAFVGVSDDPSAMLLLLNLGVLWLGLSVAMHAIPSSGDATALWELAKTHWRDSVLGVLGFPIAIFIYIANLLRILWFDLFYAIALLAVAFVGVARLFGG